MAGATDGEWSLYWTSRGRPVSARLLWDLNRDANPGGRPATGLTAAYLIVGFTIGYSQYFTTLEAITAIVVLSFLALMAGLYFGRKVRDGKIRISVERVSTGTKLIAGGILVTLSAVLLVGPPLATHAFPHFMHSVFPHRVIPSPAPAAVTTELPGAGR